MSSAKRQGSKAGRRERHLARQARVKERKRLRKARAARFAHLPGQQQPRPRESMAGNDASALKRAREAEAAKLESLVMADLRLLADKRGVDRKSKDSKARLIARIIATPTRKETT